MRGSLILRVVSALVAVMFVVMSGSAGARMAWQLGGGVSVAAQVQPRQSEHLIAHPEAVRPDAGAHAGHSSHHGSSQECTCIGACQGGGVPPLAAASSPLSQGSAKRARIVLATAHADPRTPTPYLLPFPTAPPIA